MSESCLPGLEQIGLCSTESLRDTLNSDHYLGAASRGFGWKDKHGCLVLASPTSRNIPKDWLELSRWCLKKTGKGSEQWSAVRKWLLANHEATTVISYSDPSVGHGGSLYRACGWLWAPTWHRLRPPPTGLGNWGGKSKQSVKDRWVCVLRPDPRRVQILSLKDAAIEKRKPWAQWKEPTRKRGHYVQGTGGADYSKFNEYMFATAATRTRTG